MYTLFETIFLSNAMRQKYMLCSVLNFLKPVYMFKMPSMGLKFTQTLISMGLMFTQMLINGSKCYVMWVLLLVKVCGSVHSCYLSTISTCLAIHGQHLGLFLEWILEHCASTFLNSHYLQHTQPTLQVMRDCCHCRLPWTLCISRQKIIWTLCSISSQESPPEVCQWT